MRTSIIYGLSRSREHVDLSMKFGFGISHQDIKNLSASWAKAEAENGSCPSETANNFIIQALFHYSSFTYQVSRFIIFIDHY